MEHGPVWPCDFEHRAPHSVPTAARDDRHRPASVPNPFTGTNLARKRPIPLLAPLAPAGQLCLIESIGKSSTKL
ncbi:MAG: hypothetical protein U5J83_13455 [Bryobacterales bacterium]|nr:hypothetical protein [Bryobacterales bacterium]